MAARRIHYREYQALRNRDLRDEQAYHITARRRHNIAGHRWGIVHGLALDEAQGGIVLEAGFAVDGYARELIVPEDLLVSHATLNRVLEIDASFNGERHADAWLTYCLREGDFAAGGQARRHKEEALLRLECADPHTTRDPRYPPGVPSADLPFDPQRDPPDDPEREWPVYLGRIRVRRINSGLYYDVLVSQLVYARLAGSRIRAPWGETWMQVGDEEAAASRRFSVTLNDSAGSAVDRLTLGRSGDATLRGRAAISKSSNAALDDDGNLTLLGAHDELPKGSGLALEALDSAPQAAAAWQVYRTDTSVQGAKTDQLRFEIFNPGEEGDPARQQWVLGKRDAGTTDFASLLSVRGDGTVVVEGELLVEGQFIEGAIPADVDDERFRDELLSRWTKGLTLAGAEVDAFYEPSIEVVVDMPLEWSVGDPDDLDYTITITNNRTDPQTNIPLLAVTAEFRDANRVLIASVDLPVPAYPDNRLTAVSPTVSINAATRFAVALGELTLTARVKVLGDSQNTVEHSGSNVIQITT